MSLKENNTINSDVVSNQDVSPETVSALLERLQQIEDVVLPDEFVEQAMLHSWSDMKKIYWPNGVYDKHIQQNKPAWLTEEDILKSKYVAWWVSYLWPTRAYADGVVINVYKNSVLSNFLVDKWLMERKELHRLHNMFKPFYGEVKAWIESDVSLYNELQAYVGILEKNKQFLIDNRHELVFDTKNTWSLSNLLWHEMSHNIFADFRKIYEIKSICWWIDEAFSFGLQHSVYLYDPSTIIDKTTLKDHIHNFYKLVVGRQYWYENEKYHFMKSFMLIVSGLFVASAIWLKKHDTRNQIILNKAYGSKNVGELFAFYDEAVRNIEDKDIQDIFLAVKNTSIRKLHDCKVLVNTACDEEIQNIQNLDSKQYRWSKIPRKSLREVRERITFGISRFLNKLSILALLWENELIDKKRNSFLETLHKTLGKIMENAEDKYHNEEIAQQLLHLLKE